MKLGADAIYIKLAGDAYELRPSLRASLRLVRRHGLPGLIDAVRVFNTTVIADMLREAAIKPDLLHEEIAVIGLNTVRKRTTPPLVAFVLAIAGIDPDDPNPNTNPSSKPDDPEQLFGKLFSVATGWLGWTPEQAWKATPAEIIAARSGRTELITDILSAIFGKADERTPDHYTAAQLEQIAKQGRDPAFDRASLHKLKGMERVS